MVEKNPFGVPLYGTIRGYVYISSIIIGIVASLLSLAYIRHKLKLNSNIKSILLFMGLQNLVLLIAMGCGVILMMVEESNSRLSCYLVIGSLFVCLGTDITIGGIISSLRYFMVFRASNTKILSDKDIKGFTVCCIAMQYIFWGMYFATEQVIPSASIFNICADTYLIPTPKVFIFGLLSFLQSMGWLGIGLYYDISLYQFVSKINKKEESGNKGNSIPWKSLKEEKSQNVPLKATIVSSLSLIVLIVLFGLLIGTFLNQAEIVPDWSQNIIYIFWISFQLPVFLIFTINHQKKDNAVKKIQPPTKLEFHEMEMKAQNTKKGSKLQFHDDDMESESLDENEIRIISCQKTNLPNAVPIV